MKKIYLSLLFAAAIFVSCENFLDQQPKSNIGEEDFNRNTSELLNSLTGCYNGLQGALQYEWAVTELRSDNSRIYGRSSTTTAFDYIRQLDLSTISTMNNFMENYWDGTYHNIDRCNRVLRDINVVDDTELRNRIRGEAMFLRAYHYFNLVRLWGGVFLVTEPITGDEARYKQRNSPEEVYNRIQTDLENIVENDWLPVEYPSDEIGRVTRTAAKILLAKVYMTRYAVNSTEYAKALPLLESAILEVGSPTSEGDLVPFDQIFDIDNEMNKEIIFTIRFKSGNLGIGSYFGNWFAPSGSGNNVINGGGRSYNYPSTSIINAFDNEGDVLRKDVTLAERYFNEQTNIWVEDDNSQQCRFVKKYLSPVVSVNDGESDWPVIRVADLLLLYAEAVNEIQGPTPQIINYVNIIRKRAGIPELDPMYTGDSYNFRQAIRNERRLELAFENHRWFDLLRWGIAVQRINEYYSEEFIYSQIAYDPVIAEWSAVLPIPLKVFTVNPEIAQNYGY